MVIRLGLSLRLEGVLGFVEGRRGNRMMRIRCRSLLDTLIFPLLI